MRDYVTYPHGAFPVDFWISWEQALVRQLVHALQTLAYGDKKHACAFKTLHPGGAGGIVVVGRDLPEFSIIRATVSSILRRRWMSCSLDSRIDGVLQNAAAEHQVHVLPQTHDVHLPAEQRLELIPDVHQREEAGLFKLNADIHVAVAVLLAAGHRAENPDSGYTVLLRLLGLVASERLYVLLRGGHFKLLISVLSAKLLNPSQFSKWSPVNFS